MPKADVKPLGTGPGFGWGNPKLDKVPGICYTIPVGQTDMMGALVFTINPGQFAPCEWSQSLPPFVRQQGQLTGGFVMAKKRDRSGRDRSNEKDVACLDCGTNIYRGSTRCKSCATKQRWEAGVYGSDEYCAKLSERRGQAWDNGAYDTEAFHKACQERAEKLWAEGSWGTDEWKAKQRAAKQQLHREGHYDHVIELSRTPEARAKASAMFKRLWREGAMDGKDTAETRKKRSRNTKASWARGCFDGVWTQEAREKRSRDTRNAWLRGVYDGCFQSPTSIEIELAVALDILGIEHATQRRPRGCTYVFDEFVPPNIMIEAHGDYWHNLPKSKARDIRKARWAKDHGYQLVVLWEHEIKETGAWSLVINRVMPLLEK